MGCQGYREALSARLDGEDDPAGRALVDAHLAGCAECRAWLDRAAMVTRLARTAPAPSSPGIPDSVLDAAPGRGRARLRRTLRIVLAVVGAAQFLLGVLQAASLGGVSMTASDGMVEGAMPGHLVHESAAWNIALGAGFVFVAWRRTRPTGILPILTVFVAVLSLLSLADLVDGQVNPGRLSSHLFVVVGYLAVLLLSRRTMSLDYPPPGRQRERVPSRWRLDPAEVWDEHPAPAPSRPGADDAPGVASRYEAA
jgi:predicted anti-sigma-YlaC factor YlaD